MITDLRFIEHDGEKVLQMRKSYFNDENNWETSDWQDVPTVKEGDAE